jgi:hypothetical protein
MADTSDGHVESIPEGVTTPPDRTHAKTGRGANAPPPLQLEQLWERQQELKEARLQQEQEQAELEHEIGCHREGGCARHRRRCKLEDP